MKPFLWFNSNSRRVAYAAVFIQIVTVIKYFWELRILENLNKKKGELPLSCSEMRNPSAGSNKALWLSGEEHESSEGNKSYHQANALRERRMHYKKKKRYLLFHNDKMVNMFF